MLSAVWYLAQNPGFTIFISFFNSKFDQLIDNVTIIWLNIKNRLLKALFILVD